MKLKTFEAISQHYLSQLRKLIDGMPHNGDTSDTCQRACLRNRLQVLEQCFSGVEQADLDFNILNCHEDADERPDGEILKAYNLIELQAAEIVEKLKMGGIGESDLDEAVLDCAQASGSDVNNDGMLGQVTYLLQNGWNEKEIFDAQIS